MPHKRKAVRTFSTALSNSGIIHARTHRQLCCPDDAVPYAYHQTPLPVFGRGVNLSLHHITQSSTTSDALRRATPSSSTTTSQRPAAPTKAAARMKRPYADFVLSPHSHKGARRRTVSHTCILRSFRTSTRLQGRWHQPALRAAHRVSRRSYANYKLKSSPSPMGPPTHPPPAPPPYVSLVHTIAKLVLPIVWTSLPTTTHPSGAPAPQNPHSFNPFVLIQAPASK